MADANGLEDPDTANRLRGQVLKHALLSVFVALVESGGYTSAGQMLHGSQGAISLQNQAAEGSAQTVPIQHPRYPVELLEDGRILLE